MLPSHGLCFKNHSSIYVTANGRLKFGSLADRFKIDTVAKNRKQDNRYVLDFQEITAIRESPICNIILIYYDLNFFYYLVSRSWVTVRVCIEASI